MRKRIVSLLMAVLMLAAMVPVQAAAAVSYNANAALAYAKQYWNKGNEKCAEFVADCLKAGGININPRSNARVVTLNNTLKKLGATVTELKVNNDSTISTGGSNAGKIVPGDVILKYCDYCLKYGDGKPWCHAVLVSEYTASSSRVKIYAHNDPKDGKDIYYNYCEGYWTDDGVNYTHQRTKATAYCYHFDSNSSTPSGESTLRFNIGSGDYPTGTLTPGSYFDLGGSVTSNYKITSIKGEIINSAGEVKCSGTVTPNSTSYAIKGSDLDYKMLFNKMPVGTYTLKYTAKDASGKTLNWQSPRFNIGTPYSLSFSPTAVKLDPEAKQTVSVTFAGDNIYSIAYNIGSGDICTASWSNTDFSTGKSNLTITGKRPGTTSVTVYLKDKSGSVLHSKDFSVTVNAYTAKITPSTESVAINFAKETSTSINVVLSGACPPKMQISAKIADPAIASYSWGSYTSGRTVPVNIIAKKIGTTTITFKILDGETGQTAAEKVVPVSVDAPSSTVTFNANGGTVYPSQKTVKYSLSYGELPVPTRENYQFDGWYTASGTPVTKNTVVSSAQNHTLYAYWTQIIIPVRSVSISSTSETLFLGETCQLTAYVLPANATNTGIEWHSDNPIVASVTSTGVVTAYKAGTAVITAVSADGRAAASCLITVTDVAASGTTGDANTVNWVLTADGTLTISGSGDMSNYSSSKTDALWQDKYCAQHHNVKVQKVVIQRGVTSIGNGAFSGCNDLTEVAIPGSVKIIGKSAFLRCSNLTSLTIEKGVVTIESGAFSGCSSLTHVTIPDSVTSIGQSAFNKCVSLSSVEIPSSVKSIGRAAFNECKSLSSLTLAKGVTDIGDYAFRACSSLCSLPIPSSVRSIGDGAFSKCSGLTSAIIPSSVTSMGGSVFYGCANLVYAVIPGNLASTGDLTFSDCSKLSNVILENGVKTIGCGTFSGCSSLSSITIPNSVTYIDSYAFDGCSSLSSVTVSSRVSFVGDFAFQNCSGLTNITIPSSISSIGAGAFNYCASLKDVYFTGTKDQWTAVNIGSDNEDLLNATIHCAAGLGIPTITLTTASNGNPVIKWTKVNGAAQYEVYRSDTGKDNSFKIIRRTAGLTFTDTAAAAGKTYYYVVRAINGSTAGKLCAAKSVAVALGVPAMTVKLGGDGEPVVNWTKVNGAAQYEVYRSDTGKDNSFKIIRRTAGLTYTDTSAAAGKTYYYVVRAINGSTAGKFCAAQMVLGVPTMTLTSTRNGTVIQWTKVDGAAQYEVYRSDSDKSGTFKIVRRTAGTFWKDNTAQVGKTYYYTVRAMRGSGTSLVYGGFCSAATTAHVETTKTGSGISEA